MNRFAVLVFGTTALMPLAAPAQAVPLGAVLNREGNTSLQAHAWEYTANGYRWRYLSIGHYYSLLGEYQNSTLVITEQELDDGGFRGRSATCDVDLGALKVRPDAKAVSATVHIADALEKCPLSYAEGMAPYDEIVVDLTLQAPTSAQASNSTGRAESNGLSSRYVCSSAAADTFQETALSVNGESWLLTYTTATVSVCRSNAN